MIRSLPILSMIPLALAAALSAAEGEFDQLVEKIQGDTANASEQEALRMLELARIETRPIEASVTIDAYLGTHFSPSDELLLASAEVAARSGGLRQAVERYQRYLSKAVPDQASSAAVADFLDIAINSLGDRDAAYQFLRQSELKFRAVPEARRYDTWFLAEAIRRKDLRALTTGLEQIYSQPMPEAQERLYVWPSIERAISELDRLPAPPSSELVDGLRGVLAKTRMDAGHKARLEMSLAGADMTRIINEEGDEAGKAFLKRLLASCDAYLKADRSAKAVERVVWQLGKRRKGDWSGRWDDNMWRVGLDEKQRLLVAAYGRLTDAEKDQFHTFRIDWRKLPERLGHPKQWLALGVNDARFYTHTELSYTSCFDGPGDIAGQIKAYHKMLGDRSTPLAAIARVLEAHQKDFGALAKQWFSNESWAFEGGWTYNYWRSVIQPAYQVVVGGEDKKAREQAVTRQMWLEHVGDPWLARSPMMFHDRTVAQDYIHSALDDDKSKTAARIEALNWIAFNSEVHRHVIREYATKRFPSWRNWVQKAANNQRDHRHEEAKQQVQYIKGMNAAFDRLSDQGAIDLERAPNDIAKAYASMVVAANGGNDKEMTARLEQLVKLLDGALEKKVPFAREYYRLVLADGGIKGQAYDHQVRALGQAIKTWVPGKELGFESELMRVFMQGRRDWPHNTRKDQRDLVLKANAVLTTQLAEQVKSGRIHGGLFNQVILTRRGRDWRDLNSGQEVMQAIIENDLLAAIDMSFSGFRSTTVGLMALVKGDFPGLHEQFPVESGFDEMFIREAKKDNFLDVRYWDFGRDPEGKVVAAAAGILEAYAVLPLYGTGAEVTYDNDDYANWMARVYVHGKGIDDKRRSGLEKAYDQRFDSWSMGRAWFGTNASLSGDNRATFFTRLATYIDRAGKQPARIGPPSLKALESLKADQLAENELDTLVRLFTEFAPAGWPGGAGIEHAAGLVVDALAAKGDHERLIRVAPEVWRVAANLSRALSDRISGQVKDYLKEERYELAGALAAIGMEIGGRNLDDNVGRELETALNTARSKVTSVVLVAKNDPAYPVYRSQADWQVGRTSGAWQFYSEDGIPALTRELAGQGRLNLNYLVWLMDEHIRRDEFEPADLLTRVVLTWMDNAPVPIPPEQRAEVQLKRGRIAMENRSYPVARAEFKLLAEDEQYAGTRQQVKAKVMVAEVDRLTQRFDEASEILREVKRMPDPWAKAQALFGMAKVAFDQEDFKEARELINQALEIEPDMEMTFFEKELGIKQGNYENTFAGWKGMTQTKHQPGKPLAISLTDRNSVISKRSPTIEIKVWTESTGDEEYVMLRMADDKGELFRGEIQTEMADGSKGDRMLQVLGGDRIHYDLSDEFKRKTAFQDNGQDTEMVLDVISGADLYASSGRILTKAEMEEQRLEEMLAKRLQIEVERGGGDLPLSQVRAGNQVRPGNAINLRVEDLDRNVSGNVDRVFVDVVTSSGDRVSRFELVESGAHSGEFNAALPTERLPAMAYASDSADGVDPNAVISPSQDLPAWIGSTGVSGPRYFGVDFNDLVDLATFKIRGAGAEHKTTRMVVQTSFNNMDFRTVGAWPDALRVWDGSLEAIAVPIAGDYLQRGGSSRRGSGGIDYSVLSDYIDVMSNDPRFKAQRFAPLSGTLSLSWKSDLEPVFKQLPDSVAGVSGSQSGRRKSRNQADTGIGVLVRTRAAFFVPERMTVSYFLFAHPELLGREQAQNDSLPRLFIDGKELVAPVRDEEEVVDTDEGPAELSMELGKGLHVIEMIQQVPKKEGRLAETTVKVKSPEPPYVVPMAKEVLDLSQVGEYVEQWKLRPAGVKYDDAGDTFAVDLAGHAARVVRLWLLDYEGTAPGIHKVELADSAGERVLPMDKDFDELRKNQILEVGPGDRITITYNDTSPWDPDEATHEAYMSANFFDGFVSAAFTVFKEVGATVTEAYYTVRRFELGDNVRVFVRDNDLDLTPEEDRVSFNVTSSSGKQLTLEAIETGPHTGVFQGTFFPVGGETKRDSEIQIEAGDDLTIAYRDQENTDPGIPWQRNSLIEQVVWVEPQFRVYEATSERVPEDELAAIEASTSARKGGNRRKSAEDTDLEVEALYRMIVSRPLESLPVDRFPETPTSLVLGAPVVAEVVWPTVAKSSASQVEIFAQTKAGREKAGVSLDEPVFDLSVPGTIKLVTTPSSVSALNPPAGFVSALTVGNESLANPLDAGIFTVTIPVLLGDCPDESLVGRDDLKADERALFVTADDEVYVAFRWQDQAGQEHWFSQRVKLGAAALFDVYDRKYEEVVHEFFVGETAYFRVIDPLANISNEQDAAILQVTTASGKTVEIELFETLSHSGIFQGLGEFVHYEDEGTLAETLNGIPVTYGDTLTVRYLREGVEIEQQLTIFNGSDGLVMPFTKRFRDPEIAMGTMFSIAEAYFEMAKKHRILAEDAGAKGDKADEARLSALARSEILRGKKILEEAIRDFPENSLRAQADYLLAELELEFADEAKNDEAKTRHFETALSLFTDIVAQYADSEYAPKAQYKKALVYEKMDKMDAASTEYVKLSFRYPEHELVADTITRLGGYFKDKGAELFKQAKAIGDKDLIEGERLRQQAAKFFVTAGSVFSKLRERFPSHQMAAQATVAAGMCFMWGGKYEEAIENLENVTGDDTIENAMIKSEALYWLGDAYLRVSTDGEVVLKDVEDPLAKSYLAFKTCSLEYAATIWAKRARGVLTTDEAFKGMAE